MHKTVDTTTSAISRVPGQSSTTTSSAGALSSNAMLLQEVAVLLAGATLVGVLAQVSIPMWPVPITGQTLGVTLVGAFLGARRGALSMLSYVLLGLAGVPWFANFGGGPAYVLKPSFGFLLAFIATAWAVGYLAERGWDRTLFTAFGMYLGTSLIVFVGGVHYLWAVMNLTGVSMSYEAAWLTGCVPFLLGDVIKCALATLIRQAVRR